MVRVLISNNKKTTEHRNETHMSSHAPDSDRQLHVHTSM